MPDNMNQSAGSGRHKQRPAASVVRRGQRGDGIGRSPDQATLDELRDRDTPAVIQFNFIRDSEMDDN